MLKLSFRGSLAGPTAADTVAALSASPPTSNANPERKTPVPADAPVWEAPFLEAYARHGTVEGACRSIGLHRQRVYQRRRVSPEFAAAWVDAKERHGDLLEAELFRRGKDGWDEAVFFGGECVGTKRRYSDNCLIVAVKAARPGKYRDGNDGRHASPPDAPIRTAAEVTAQLAPYEGAIAMMVAGVVSRELVQRPALPAPTGPEVIDVKPVGACPRCDGPGVNPYCPVCHGAGRIG